MRLFAAVLALLLIAPGCYTATVVTGRPMGSTVVQRPFAMGFIYGLIPPPEVNVAQECPQGVAMVRTQMSFVNGLVSALTGGILTPWTIMVTCASGTASLPSSAVEVAASASTADIQAAFAEAAEQAVETEAPVFVAFK